jgi:NAD(P)-dependent dehydrogenase (short-subunit alcohol dehydrogenase family)
MRIDLRGHVALVTGAASGIGRASALALGDAGARVTAVDIDEAGLDETARRARLRAADVLPVAADVRSFEAVTAVVERVVAESGSLDIAVNSAGVPGPYLPLVDYTEDQFRGVLEVDLLGVWRCLRQEARQMLRQRRGSIVTISSILGAVAMPDNSAYVAAKHAVEGLTRAAAVELAPAGIRVNAVAPGVTRTGMTNSVSDDLLHDVPLRRIAEPEEIAGAVVWLCSDASSYVTGSILTADGGYLAR